MNGKIRIVLFLLTFICIANFNAQEISKETEQALNDLGKKLEQATLEGKLLSTLQYYTEDIIIMPGFHSAIKGKSQLKETFEKNKERGLKYHSFSGTVEKRWQRGNEIYERGTFGMAVSDKHHSKPKAYYGSYFQICKKDPEGKFKIDFIIWNLDFNPCE